MYYDYYKRKRRKNDYFLVYDFLAVAVGTAWSN